MSPLPPFPTGELTDAAELGAVTDRSVRIWARAPGRGLIEATLSAADGQRVAGAVRCAADTDWTGVLDLAVPRPAPNTAFVCTVGERRLSGRFAPAVGAPTAFHFAFGSCHFPFRQQQDGRVVVSRTTGIYRAMRSELAALDARLLLLLGDQIYADHLAPVGVDAVLPAQGVPPFAAALDAYRWLYRGFFAEPGLRALREAVPTLTTWDDHEIVNDWGSHRVERPRDRRLFAAASRAYGEYQQQRNPDGVIGPPPFSWSLPFGDTAFFALDLRGVRDYEAGLLLGGEQWDQMQGWLAGVGTTARTLFIITSVPVAYVSRWLPTALAWLPARQANALRDRWSSPAFVQGRDALLHALCDWQAAARDRQVFLLSGDVHAASAATIARRRGGGVIQQLISSPLTTPLSAGLRVASTVALQAPNLCEPAFALRRHFVSFSHNYGVVAVEPTGGGHRVRFTARAWDGRAGAARTVAALTWRPAAAT